MIPFLRYAGSKQRYFDKISRYFPRNMNEYYYVDLFLGSGSLLFNLKPVKGLINDANRRLISCYKHIRDNPRLLMCMLDEHLKLDSRVHYEKVKEKYNLDMLGEIQVPAAFIYLNARCFNGLYRENSKGEFNVSYDANRKNRLYNRENIMEISRYLNDNDILIIENDYLTVQEKLLDFIGMNNDLFYVLDPPYISKDSNSNFIGYGNWNESMYDAFLEFVSGIHSSTCKFLLFNSDNEMIRDYFNNSDFNIYTYHIKRHINCKIENRNLAYNELIITNYTLPRQKTILDW